MAEHMPWVTCGGCECDYQALFQLIPATNQDMHHDSKYNVQAERAPGNGVLYLPAQQAIRGCPDSTNALC
jgi:hypothetical protein